MSVFIILTIILSFILLISYICYRMAFYAQDRSRQDLDEIKTPKGKIYEPFRENMVNWVKETRAMPYEKFRIKSFDGLTLNARYFEYAPGAPIEIMFHGYRGSSECDLAGGVQRCFKLGRSAILVDQRCSRESDGNVISFGINEHRDCLSWVDFACRHFGPDAKFILTGISMGASTVLMAAGRPLPENVIGVLADCGYSTARDIIRKVIADMGFPSWLVYPFVKLGAKVFGHFDLEEYSALEAMKTCSVPVIFFHGEDDSFVPCDMSRQLYETCASSKKKLVTIPEAGHGLSYPVAPKAYLNEAYEFFGPEASHYSFSNK